MVLFPYCKINIGLDILARRTDGFHEIETAMFPVRGLCDILEIVKADRGVGFSSSGLAINCPPEKNICVKAYELMADRYAIGGARIHLHKVIPFGAGLGGGSADAAFVIKGLNELYGLGLDTAEMERLAAETGSDTAFFISGTPQIARGRGEKLSPAHIDLSGKTLVIVKPPIAVSTAEAYAGVVPHIPPIGLAERLTADISQWRGLITNDFERHIFAARPELPAIKDKLYASGAVYAAMSGSGSAIYGLFDTPPAQIEDQFEGFVHSETIA